MICFGLSKHKLHLQGARLTFADDELSRASELISFEAVPRKKISLSTPSKNDKDSILQQGIVEVQLNDKPLVTEVPTNYKNPYSPSQNEALRGGGLTSLVTEEYFYQVGSYAPPWLTEDARGASAKKNRSAVCFH